jgi:hypothetical protein
VRLDEKLTAFLEFAWPTAKSVGAWLGLSSGAPGTKRSQAIALSRRKEEGKSSKEVMSDPPRRASYVTSEEQKN